MSEQESSHAENEVTRTGAEPAYSEDPELAGLKGEDLEAAKTRAEIRTLRLSLEELRIWRSKLIFTSVLTILAPLGSVLLFFVGWYGSHTNERRHQEDALYTQAAKQLADKEDASVRLSGVLTLTHFIHPKEKTIFARVAEGVFAKNSENEGEERSRAVMALLIGALARENDPAVLDAIAAAAAQRPDAALTPLAALNKAAVVQFARAAGHYSGLSALRMKRKASFSMDYWKNHTWIRDKKTNKLIEIQDPTIDDLVILLLRTGSPFEVATNTNQRFSARNFLTRPDCSFRELLSRQQLLTTGEGFNSDMRVSVPSLKETNKAMQETIAAALTLERTSYILGSLVNEHWDDVDAWARENVDGSKDKLKREKAVEMSVPKKKNSLYGTAIVVGALTEQSAANYRSRGGYYTSSFEDDDKNPGCRFPGN